MPQVRVSVSAGQVLASGEDHPDRGRVFDRVQGQHFHRFDHVERLAVAAEIRSPASSSYKLARLVVEQLQVLRPACTSATEGRRWRNSLMQVKAPVLGVLALGFRVRGTNRA